MRDSFAYRPRATPAEHLIAKNVKEELQMYAMRQALKRTANTLGISLGRVITAYATVKGVPDVQIAQEAGLQIDA